MAGDYEWYVEADLEEYNGMWIAIHDKNVIAAEKDFSKLVNEVTKKFKLSDVFVAHIPKKGVALV